MKKISIEVNSFISFLDSLSNISDSVIVDVKSDRLQAFVSSEDNTVYLPGDYFTESTSEVTLNIPDIRKLARAIEATGEQNIDLIINSNSLEYRGKSTKFRYHLFDDGIITRSQSKIDKIKAFRGDVRFNLSKSNMQKIVKHSAFANNTNKVYLSGNSGELIAELTDKTKSNIDSITNTIGVVDVEFTANPVNIDNLKRVTFFEDTQVELNTEFSVLIVYSEHSKFKLKYVIAMLSE